MKKPVIGITGYSTQPNAGVGLRRTYIDAVLHSGGLPVILPMLTQEEDAVRLLRSIDGLLLSGGGDIDPKLFGEEKRPECNAPDVLRDACELLLARLAREMRMPVFGICRGVQVLNVAYGGTLIQDIASQCGIPCGTHRQGEPYDALVHDVQLTPGGLLNRLTGLDRFATNSLHHQAVAALGGTLVAEAVCADGIIEAVSDSANPAIFGVQFHPEFFCKQKEYARKMFDYFTEQAAAFAASRQNAR